MYCMVELIILFLVGLSHRECIFAEVNNNEYLSPNDFGLYPKQFNDIKTVVVDVLKNYVNSPSSKLFIQKNLRSPPELKFNAKIISDSLLTEAHTFFHNLGLINSNIKRNQQISFARERHSNNLQSSAIKDSISNEVFSFIYKFVPIGQEIMSTIQNHYRRRNYREKGYSPSNFSILEIITQQRPHVFKMVSIATSSKRYINAYFECWDKNITFFNTPSALASITKHPPRITKKIAVSRLSKTIPRHPHTQNIRYNEHNAMICQLLVERVSSDKFEFCLKQFQLIDECIEEKLQKPDPTQSLKWRTAHNLNENINNLNTSCKVKMNNSLTTLTCEHDIDTNGDHQFFIIIRKFVGNSFMKSTMSQNVVKQLGNLISKSKFGDEIIHELNSLCEIYQESVLKKKELLRKARSDRNAIGQYNEYSRQLLQYTTSLTDVALKVVDEIRNITMTFEKALIDIVSIAVGANMSNNLRSVRCIGTLWNAIIEAMRPKFKNRTNGNKHDWRERLGYPRVSLKNSNKYLTGRRKQPIFDLSPFFNHDWLSSMRTLARISHRRKPSTIMTLANTFLLATMFYECIVILAAAIYRSENQEDISTQSMIQLTTEANDIEEISDPLEYMPNEFSTRNREREKKRQRYNS